MFSAQQSSGTMLPVDQRWSPEGTAQEGGHDPTPMSCWKVPVKGNRIWKRNKQHLSLSLWGFDPQHPCSMLGWGAANTAWAESGMFPSFPQLPSLLCVPKLGGHSPGVSQGLRAQPCRAQPGCPQSHKHRQEVSLIYFSFPSLLLLLAKGR